MQLTLNYNEILEALILYCRDYKSIELYDLTLTVDWDKEYDSKPPQENFNATANFRILS